MAIEKVAAQGQPKDIWSVNNQGVFVAGEQKATFEKISKANALSPEEDAKLKKACKDFESYFLYYMLKEMRASVPKNEGIMKNSRAQEIYQDMFDEKIADRMANGRGMGLADTLYKQVKDILINKIDAASVDKKG